MSTQTTINPDQDIANRIRQLLSAGNRSNQKFVVPDHTFGDVRALAAGILQDLPEKDAVACLCTENKAFILASLLASLAGGFSLVLPYALTPKALADVRDRLPFSVLITDDPKTTPPGIRTLTPRPAADNPTLSLETPPDREFFYFFTGGSTGRPQVWSKTPINLFAEGFYQTARHRLTEDDLILATVPPYHIYGFLFSVLFPLVSSARVVNPTPTYPEEIRHALLAHRPTVFVSVPAHYRVLNGADIRCDSPRMAFSSAGRLDPADGEAFHAKTGADVVEVYGSTETGGIATRCRNRGETGLTPFDGIDWKIENELLCVRSPFISPGIETDKEGFFVTGDRVRKSGNAAFELIGRADGIVKVGGNRVDLEDIRMKLTGLDGVDDAVVIALPSENGRENEICALVQGNADKDRLLAAASDLLEPAALPRRVTIVDALPVTAAGKYDRDAIKAVFSA